ncbi:MAG TPA: VOC family protein [Solirubrobacteraceae bacterium]|nr:VOC family protein [Solirubrobacteraceae bacterium]
MSFQPPRRVYETVLYAEDLDATTAFYRDVLGLRLVDSSSGLVSAFRVPDGSMLLIFDPRRSCVAGRPAPSHGAGGAGHVAFQVDGPELETWRARLRQLGISIEQDRSDGDATGQLYFRDPAGNSVELVRGELWPD